MNTFNGPIFVRDSKSGLRAVANDPNKQGYAKEKELQNLIALHPELLRGDQIDPKDPRRWLLIKQEVGIPEAAGVSDRWSIDHVFIDQEAIPTFIEVKRSSDARIRREVVGQLIEYAANAKQHWPKGHLEGLCRARLGAATDAAVMKLCGAEAVAAAFWTLAESNLRDGNVRLIFVADRIPEELHQMARFLNDQMTRTEVLAIEVRPYGPQGAPEVFVPHVLNATLESREVKSSATGRRKWTKDEFFEDARKRLSPEGLAAVRLLVEFASKGAISVTWGTGVLRGCFNPKYPGSEARSPFGVRSDGTLTLNGFWLPEPYGARLIAISREMFGLVPNEKDFDYVPLGEWIGKQDQLIADLGAAMTKEG